MHKSNANEKDVDIYVINCVVMLMFSSLISNASAEKSGRKGRYSPAFSKMRYVIKSDVRGARIIESKIYGITINPATDKTKSAIIIRIKVHLNSSRWSQNDISFSFMRSLI